MKKTNGHAVENSPRTEQLRGKHYRTKNDLPDDVRNQIIDLANARLADCVDLLMQAKQAHWNVRGPHFIGLHELFDKVHEVVEVQMDAIAERVGQLGGVTFGSVRHAAAASNLAEYPTNISDGVAHVDALSTALSTFGKHMREAIDTADEAGDAGTADLFTDVSREIDQMLWFVEAHLQAEN